MPTFLLAALAMTFLAANSPFARIAVLDGTDPVALAAVRVAAGAGTLLILARGRVPAMATGPRRGAALALTVYLLGFSLAYRSLDAGLGALVLFGTVQIALLGAGAVRGERLDRRRAGGMGLALAGLVWLLWPGRLPAVSSLDTALMVAAGLGWAAYSYAGKFEPEPLRGSAGNFVLATGLLALLVPIWWGAAVTPLGVASAAVSGAVTSGIGYAILFRVLPRIALWQAGLAQLSVPVIAAAMGAAALGEVPSPSTFLAGSVVLGGIAAATVPQARRRARR